MVKKKDKIYIVKIFVGIRYNGKWKIKGSEAEVEISAPNAKEALTVVGKMLGADSHPWGREKEKKRGKEEEAGWERRKREAKEKK